MIGKKFNKLTIIEYSHTKRYNSFWKCRCECGNYCIVSLDHLKTGHTKSCGCLRIYKHPRGESGLIYLYNIYKKRAKKFKRKFDLSLDEFKEITSKNCSYCNSRPNKISQPPINKKYEDYVNYKYNGIDRINSTRGYEKDNIVPCCEWCNLAKGDKNTEEFKEHIFKIFKFMRLFEISVTGGETVVFENITYALLALLLPCGILNLFL